VALSPGLSRDAIAAQLAALGVTPGGVLLVHAAYRAVRPVEGGPETLIAALCDAIGPDGTLVMPSWTGDADAVFDPRITPAAADLGAVADIFWRLPGVGRSAHPEAFAAIGPATAHILADPLPLPPHIPASPVGRVRDLDGQILLLGVGHDANTSLHLAELIADVPYRTPAHVTVAGEDGSPRRIDYLENDHCCMRFALMDDWLRAAGLQSEGTVGHAHARLMRARGLVATALARLADDPLIFLHAAEEDCEECDAARTSIAMPTG